MKQVRRAGRDSSRRRPARRRGARPRLSHHRRRLAAQRPVPCGQALVLAHGHRTGSSIFSLQLTRRRPGLLLRRGERGDRRRRAPPRGRAPSPDDLTARPRSRCIGGSSSTPLIATRLVERTSSPRRFGHGSTLRSEAPSPGEGAARPWPGGAAAIREARRASELCGSPRGPDPRAPRSRRCRSSDGCVRARTATPVTCLVWFSVGFVAGGGRRSQEEAGDERRPQTPADKSWSFSRHQGGAENGPTPLARRQRKHSGRT